MENLNEMEDMRRNMAELRKELDKQTICLLYTSDAADEARV